MQPFSDEIFASVPSLAELRYPVFMPKSAGQRHWKNTPTKLTGPEVAEASKVGRRLLADLRPLFDKLPRGAQTSPGMVEYLQIDRGTAARLVAVLTKPTTELEALRNLPGVRGLRQALDSMSERNMPKGEIERARAAIVQFERLIHDLAGSQTKLAEKLALSPAMLSKTVSDTDERQLRTRRRRLFESAADLLGQRSETCFVTQVFRPTPGTPDRMDHAALRGRFGYHARRDAPSLVLLNYGLTSDLKDDDQPTAGSKAYTPIGSLGSDASPEACIFQEFSTPMLPLVTAKGDGRHAQVTIDPTKIDSAQGLDVVAGSVLLNNWGHPIHESPPRHDVSLCMTVPAGRLLFDVFLHESMAKQSMVSLKVYRTSPGIFATRVDHWFDELSHPPSLQLVDPRSHNVGSRYIPRYGEMLDTFFARLGWGMNEFACYRCEVEYPVWCGYYCMVFDYSKPESGV